jgi:hypothetical protein
MSLRIAEWSAMTLRAADSFCTSSKKPSERGQRDDGCGHRRPPANGELGLQFVRHSESYLSRLVDWLSNHADHPEITLSRREIRSQGVAADRGSCRRTQRRISELTRLPKALQEELTCQSTSVAFDMSLARSRKRLVED